MSGACCSVGARPDAAEIDAALRAGQGLGTVAKRFPLLAKSSLGVHRARCLGMGVQGASSAPSSQPSSASDVAGESVGPESGNQSEVQEKDVVGEEQPTVQKVARARGGSGEVAAHSPGGVQATVQAPAVAARTDDEHVQAIADQMADGLWVGRRSVREYANAHGLKRGQVKDFARAAALVCYADEEEIEQRRQPALGRWLSLYEAAMDGEEPDLKAAASALTGYDRAAGIVKPAGPAVQVNIGLDEASRAMASFLLAAAPQVRPLFVEWLSAIRAGNAQAKADPAAWVAARGRRELTALPGGDAETTS